MRCQTFAVTSLFKLEYALCVVRLTFFTLEFDQGKAAVLFSTHRSHSARRSL